MAYRNDERVILSLILVVFTVLGVTYSVVVPPFEASDELWHYPMVKYIADHWALPVQEPGVETPWRQEGSQPPLYYALAAVATSWIDTSDVEVARHLNRHVDNGVATADGNVNLIVHHPAREAFPWRGTVLAVHLIRFLSVLMGTAAVYLTYLIAREVLPDQPGLALGAAAMHAFTPMYVFISGAVNNDNLVVPLSSLALLTLLRLLRQRELSARQSLLRYLGLGVLLGLAVLTKTSAAALTLLAALVVVIRAARRRSWAEFLIGGFATLLPFLAIAGWWFLRNWQLYGDLTGLNVFTEILGTREIPANLAQLWRERYSFMAGYWGNFGGLNVPMPRWVYGTLNAAVVLAIAGMVRVASGNSKLATRNSKLAICLLWGVGVVIPWSVWASTTWSSQGRLVFSAIPVWSLLLTMGLAGLLPRRWRQWPVAVFALFLLILASAAPFAWIEPAYALPEPLTDAQAADIPHQAGTEFGGILRLLGYDLETTDVQPGGQVAVTLYWQALASADRDYVTFVQLLGAEELLVAQRDTLPGLGTLSTTWLEPGFRWADRYVLQVPDTAYTPDVAQVQVGLYDSVSGVRLSTGGAQASDNVRFGQVQVHPKPGDVPNPISINFGDRIELIGYDLDRRAAQPGETVTLTLHWRCLRSMDVNYNVSVQFLNAVQRKVAQHDGWPLDGAAPTASWEAGHTLTDTYTLDVYPDAPGGVYDVRVVIYTLGADEQIVHLPTIPAGGQMQSSHVTLTTMKVAAP